MLEWTSKSEDDLDEIREYIAKNFNVDLAISSVNELINYAESLLSKNPLAGSVLASNPLFSQIVFKGNSIYYCENPKNKNLYVVYVHARRTKILKERINNKEVA